MATLEALQKERVAISQDERGVNLIRWYKWLRSNLLGKKFLHLIFDHTVAHGDMPLPYM